jgi:hypothetical protein
MNYYELHSFKILSIRNNSWDLSTRGKIEYGAQGYGTYQEADSKP